MTEIDSLRHERDNALEAARFAIRDTTRVTRILSILGTPVSMDSMLDNVLSTVSELFSADVVALVDPAGTGSFRPIASIGLPGEILETFIGDFDETTAFGEIMAQASLTGEWIRSKAKFPELLSNLGIEKTAFISLRDSQEPRGALILGRCKAEDFGKRDIELLGAIADRIGITLEQAERKNKFETMIKTGNERKTSGGERDLASYAAGCFKRISCGDACALLLRRDGADGPLVIGTDASAIHAVIWDRLWYYLGDDGDFMAGKAIRAYTDGTNRTGQNRQYETALFAELPYKAILAAPLHCNGAYIGIICSFRTAGIGFSANMVQYATLFAGQIAPALENARLYQNLLDELHERKRAEDSLRDSRERFASLLHNVSDVVVVLNDEGSLTYSSEASISAWGVNPFAVIGRNIREIAHPEDIPAIDRLLGGIRESGKKSRKDIIRMRTGAGLTCRYFEMIVTDMRSHPSVTGIVATFHDVNDRKLQEIKLKDMAFHDQLTGLANRTFFIERLKMSLLYRPTKGTSVAVIFLDLDGFKSVNDTYGHAAGDLVLQAVAKRLLSCVRVNDLASRFGGDEFAVVLEGVASAEKITPLTERILHELSQPIALADGTVAVDSSIGVAISDESGEEAEALLRRADEAMYEAKRAGKGRCAFYGSTFST